MTTQYLLNKKLVDNMNNISYDDFLKIITYSTLNSESVKLFKSCANDYMHKLKYNDLKTINTVFLSYWDHKSINFVWKYETNLTTNLEFLFNKINVDSISVNFINDLIINNEFKFLEFIIDTDINIIDKLCESKKHDISVNYIENMMIKIVQCNQCKLFNKLLLYVKSMYDLDLDLNLEKTHTHLCLEEVMNYIVYESCDFTKLCKSYNFSDESIWALQYISFKHVIGTDFLSHLICDHVHIQTFINLIYKILNNYSILRKKIFTHINYLNLYKIIDIDEFEELLNNDIQKIFKYSLDNQKLDILYCLLRFNFSPSQSVFKQEWIVNDKYFYIFKKLKEVGYFNNITINILDLVYPIKTKCVKIINLLLEIIGSWGHCDYFIRDILSTIDYFGLLAFYLKNLSKKSINLLLSCEFMKDIKNIKYMMVNMLENHINAENIHEYYNLIKYYMRIYKYDNNTNFVDYSKIFGGIYLRLQTNNIYVKNNKLVKLENNLTLFMLKYSFFSMSLYNKCKDFHENNFLFFPCIKMMTRSFNLIVTEKRTNMINNYLYCMSFYLSEREYYNFRRKFIEIFDEVKIETICYYQKNMNNKFNNIINFYVNIYLYFKKILILDLSKEIFYIFLQLI